METFVDELVDALMEPDITRSYEEGDLAVLSELAELAPDELQKYCTENEIICSREDLWEELLIEVFPDVYYLLTDVEFVDMEKELRKSHRKFMPLRELYTQLLAVSIDSPLLQIVDELLNNADLVGMKEETLERLRIYYQMISSILAQINARWFSYLLDKDDIILDYLPLTEENLRFWHTRSPRLSYRYFSNPAVDPNVPVGMFGKAPIANAAFDGQYDVVELLLKRGADPSAQSNDAIRSAAAAGHHKIVRLLLGDPRVDPSENNNEALRDAVMRGHMPIVRLLLDDLRVVKSGLKEALRVASSPTMRSLIKQAM